MNRYIVAKIEIKERLTGQVVSRMFEVDFAKENTDYQEWTVTS